jgi:hypothetical protein
MMSQVPQNRIKLSPYFVGSMIPRPSHIQRKFSQGIETINIGGQRTSR